ncbi:alcohol dehydrogenase GroES-like domain-containing protein [Xylaria arbuscula]|nr:alcohol dehydrogenase GroES-like domain-containing protein [Xylaria arbuscula]
MKALVSDDSGRYQLTQDKEIFSPRPGQLLIHVHAVALNPADAKMMDYSATAGRIGGHDFAGMVARIGEGITRYQIGDRVLATTIGLSPSDRTAGAFAEYALGFADLACKIPDDMSFENACPMGVSIGTAGMALFQTLQLRMPGHQKPDDDTLVPVLVSGGATSTGTMAVQLLKCAGFTPIVTCSPANNTLCQSFGAAACFDYHSPSCGADIRAWTDGRLAYVFDCVTDAATMEMCYQAIGFTGGKYVAIDPISTAVQYSRRDVLADWLMVYSLIGEPLKLAGVYGRPASPKDRVFAGRLFETVEKLLGEGEVRGHPIEIRSGGLGALAEGIEELRMGRVRAKKLVYPLLP